MPVDATPKNAPPPSGGVDASSPKLSLQRAPFTFLDRWLPASPGAFLATVAGIAIAVWLLGLALASDRARFLADRDWQCQPIYLATHFVILRLFVTSYSKNFLLGCQRLTIDRDEANRRVRRALGPLGWLVALGLAAPFVWFDLAYLTDGGHVADDAGQGIGGALGPADVLAGAVWTFEWIINAYVWVIILGFLAMTMRMLKAHGFRDEIDIVLGERHYRPFLLMSAQGASIVLGFSIVTAAYVWRVEGEATDQLGLWITAGLLVVGFVPPWLRLKNGLARLARTEADRLNRDIQTGWRTLGTPEPVVPSAESGVLTRLNLLLTMARAGHLERLYRDLGRNEGQAVLLRLLAPVSTLVWKLFRPG